MVCNGLQIRVPGLRLPLPCRNFEAGFRDGRLVLLRTLRTKRRSQVNVMREIYAVALSLLVLTPTSALRAQENPVAFPKEYCHALQRPVQQVFPQLTGNHYARIQNQPRWDVVCIGDVVRIDVPLRSNGGDIFVFANRLEVSAPIDSRPYLSPDDIDPYLPPFPIGQGQYESQTAVAPPGSDLRKIYDDYFRRSPDAIHAGGKTWLPELAPGLVGNGYRDCENPSEENMRTLPPSIPAPNVSNAPLIRPGNIAITASAIIFDDEKLKSFPLFDGDPLSCDTVQPSTVGKGFVTRGLRGGRGGPGVTLAPFYHTGSTGGNVRFTCAAYTYQRAGRLNAQGGPGGEGGDISISFVGDLTPEVRSSLTEHSAFDGGPAGSKAKLRAPSFNGPAAAKSYDACGFVSEGVWEAAPPGKSGTLDISAIDSSAGMIELSRTISALDSRPDYNFDELLLRAAVPAEKIRGFSYGSFVERKLFEKLIDTEIAWLGSFRRYANTGTDITAKILTGIWTGIDMGQMEQGPLSSQTLHPLRLLTNFDRVGTQGPINSYFYRSGGAFNIRSVAAVNQWSELASRTEATLTSLKLDEIKKTLSVISGSVNDIREVAKSAHYKSLLDELNARLLATEEAAKAASAEASSANAMAGVKEAAEGVVLLVAAYNTGSATSAGAGAVKLQRGIQRLGRSQLPPADYGEDIKRLNLAILETLRNYDDFLKYSATMKSRILDEQRDTLVAYFETNSAYGARMQARSILFHDLIRVVVIGAFQDPSRNKAEIQSNLEALEILLRDYPSREPVLSYRDVSTSCSVQQGEASRCEIFLPREVWRYVLSDQEDWTKNIPLYVLAPSTGQQSLPTFGSSWRLASENPEIIVSRNTPVRSD